MKDKTHYHILHHHCVANLMKNITTSLWGHSFVQCLKTTSYHHIIFVNDPVAETTGRPV